MVQSKQSQDPDAIQEKCYVIFARKAEAISECCLADTKEVLKALVLQLKQTFCPIMKKTALCSGQGIAGDFFCSNACIESKR